MRREGKAVVGRAIGLVVLMSVTAAGIVGLPAAEGQARPGVGRPAPEIAGGPWINSEPLSLAGLRGRVVLVEFWTYG
jgi:hypothetical protein